MKSLVYFSNSFMLGSSCTLLQIIFEKIDIFRINESFWKKDSDILANELRCCIVTSKLMTIQIDYLENKQF